MLVRLFGLNLSFCLFAFLVSVFSRMKGHLAVYLPANRSEGKLRFPNVQGLQVSLTEIFVVFAGVFLWVLVGCILIKIVWVSSHPRRTASVTIPL